MDKNSQAKKPLLIYDGGCEFCLYWVSYWKKLTEDRVDYQPYQDVQHLYPNIPEEAFQNAVQYVAPDGEVSSAAKASFLTLSHAKGRPIGLTLYKHLPGFKAISERVYQFIASHRDFSFKVSKLCWGKERQPSEYSIASWLFLRGLALMFMAAFFSLGSQVLGLVGSNGITPVSNLMAVAEQQLGPERYYFLPMVFWFFKSDAALQWACTLGLFSSILLLIGALPRTNLIIMYVLYTSLVTAGQVFFSFQWDLLLLESSMIGLILCCNRKIGIWLLWWLVFRFMFAGGFVKLLSGDPSWWDLTALNYHFLTQPLPTPLAWYADKLPEFFLKLCTLVTLTIEMVIVFLIFFPRRVRFFAGLCILFLQFIIMITGNYNFFNLTTMVLCISLFDDTALKKIMPTFISNAIMQRSPYPQPGKALTTFAIAFAAITITMSVIQISMRFGVVPARPIIATLQYLSPLRLVNNYGPFAVMTKRRLEIIIEGSMDEEEWKTYEFKYKPGPLNRRPLWNIPFQPRLDWQMWFAALGTPRQNPWFFNFMQRLLEGSPNVVGLLKNNPFPDGPPKHIRAQMYNYTFSTFDERSEYGDWWDRNYVDVYVPSLQLRRQDSDS